MHNLSKEHWQVVKWILLYFLKTVDIGLLFERDDTCNQYAIGFVDSDYVGELNKWRSTTGYVFTLSGPLVSWKSALQFTISLSTTKAEYIALTEAVREAIWLGGLLDEFGVGHKQISIYSGSQSVVSLAKNPVFHVRTKHINVHYHFV